jgi:hypothetical protein
MKNICTKSCALSAVFGAGSIACFLNTKKGAVMKDFKESLNEKQKEKYEDITNNRRNIYTNGLMLGAVLSIATIYILGKKQLLSINNLCIFVSTVLITSYLYYILSPKGEYMIIHLNDAEQREKWLKIYKKMQFNYHAGLVFGIVSVIIASRTVCK